MSWVTIVWSMAASACLTLAAMHLLVWSRKRAALANLLFALSSAATTAYAACELWMMRSQTPEEFATAVRYLHVPVWVIIVSLVAFTRLYLRAGRPWLAWTVCGARTLALLLNFGPAANLNFREVSALRRVAFFGDTVSVGVGVPNPWMLVGQLSLLLFVVFVADASVSAWRRGDRRQALVVGGSLLFFAAGGAIESILVLWEIVHAPLTATLLYQGLIAAMGYQLSDDVLRAARLSDDLREREQQMTLAADAADLGLWIWTTPTDTVWATERLRPLLGVAPGESISMVSFLEHVHPEDREPTRRALAVALDEKSDYSAEYRVLLPDGSQRWIAARGRVESPARDGAARMLGVCIDITLRKRAEEHFRLVVEASPSAMVLADDEGRVQLVNSETERLFGYTRVELAGTSIEVLLPGWPRGDHDRGLELSARRKDGSEFAAEVTPRLIQRSSQSLVLVAIVDVTARKQAEAERLRVRTDLAHAGRLSTMAQLASSLAHELNQPLGAILRNAEAAELLMQASPPDLEEVCAILVDIRQDDHRAGEIIDHMRGLLKRRDPERVRLEVAKLVDGVLVLVNSDAASRKVRLDVAIPPLPPVRGDRVQLQQVLLNLILNGMDALADVPVERRRLCVSARRADAGTIEVAVADGGPGVAAEKLARLFEPFFTTKPDGLGLGLPISATIIGAHGGRIWAQSAATGATFFFTLPVSGEA